MVDPIDIVRDILARTGTIARLMEIYCLVEEPGVLGIVRELAALSDEKRGMLGDFLLRMGSAAALHLRRFRIGTIEIELEVLQEQAVWPAADT